MQLVKGVMHFKGNGVPNNIIYIICNVIVLPGHKVVHSVAYTLKWLSHKENRSGDMSQ